MQSHVQRVSLKLSMDSDIRQRLMVPVLPKILVATELMWLNLLLEILVEAVLMWLNLSQVVFFLLLKQKKK